MKLKLFKTLWGHSGDIGDAIAACQVSGWAGIEGQAPVEASARKEWRTRLVDAGLDYIAEICTGGSYVPDRQLSPYKHLESLQRKAAAAMECDPLFLTVIAGCDAWSLHENLDFFAAATRIVEQLGITPSFETHRSRSLFNPWITRDILRQMPGLKLTCDYSHWCVVCERLVDTEPEILTLCAAHAHHVHARVGYDQGPQVPHPAAPAYRKALEAHERWWSLIWENQRSRGCQTITMTPEFGPDGYLQSDPFTGEPVADLEAINLWMADRQRQRFEACQGNDPGLQPDSGKPVYSN